MNVARVAANPQLFMWYISPFFFFSKMDNILKFYSCIIDKSKTYQSLIFKDEIEMDILSQLQNLPSKKPRGR